MQEARAQLKNIRSSPRRMRLVIDLIRGKNVNEALGILRFMPNKASRDAEQVLRSAVANLMSRDEEGRVDPDSIYVSKVYVDQGPTMKRIQPAPMGRAHRIRKRSNHLTIIVGSK